MNSLLIQSILIVFFIISFIHHVIITSFFSILILILLIVVIVVFRFIIGFSLLVVTIGIVLFVILSFGFSFALITISFRIFRRSISFTQFFFIFITIPHIFIQNFFISLIQFTHFFIIWTIIIIITISIFILFITLLITNITNIAFKIFVHLNAFVFVTLRLISLVLFVRSVLIILQAFHLRLFGDLIADIFLARSSTHTGAITCSLSCLSVSIIIPSLSILRFIWFTESISQHSPQYGCGTISESQHCLMFLNRNR
mmetsp:Transcript_5068/g.8206  ORF Transcript_5068/g.8206 Transcript_5068/m.8206 type:complete len:257 (-) Transcript_5068:119-889(-)